MAADLRVRGFLLASGSVRLVGIGGTGGGSSDDTGAEALLLIVRVLGRRDRDAASSSLILERRDGSARIWRS